LISDMKIACFGLAFKPDIDDFRESPALQIALNIASEYDSQLLIVEPNITELPLALRQKKTKLVEIRTAIDQADLLVLLVDHNQFKQINPRLFSSKLIVDTRGIWTS